MEKANPEIRVCGSYCPLDEVVSSGQDITNIATALKVSIYDLPWMEQIHLKPRHRTVDKVCEQYNVGEEYVELIWNCIQKRLSGGCGRVQTAPVNPAYL